MSANRTAPVGDGSASSPDNGEMLDALDRLFNETVLLHHRMRSTVERIHREGTLTSARRSVLRDLALRGPLTVPQMACARLLSRQHVQPVVDALAREGLVELVPNPAHKRSRLVRLTPLGKQRIETMLQREAEMLKRLPLDATPAQLHHAAVVLRAVRQAMEEVVTSGQPSELSGATGAKQDAEELTN